MKAGITKTTLSSGEVVIDPSTARDIARHFGSIDAIEAASKDALLEVAEVGEVIAGSVYDYMHNPVHLREIERLKAFGLRFETVSGAAASEALEGLSIVISGNFRISRDAMKELILSHGGRCSSSVSGSTSFLLAGTKPGPEKLRKCETLGIPVKSEAEFMAMLPGGAPGAGRDEELTLF